MAPKFPFDSLVLAKVIEEAQIAVGGYIKRVGQADEHTITLRAGHSGENFNLLVCTNPQFMRFHLSRGFQSAESSGFGKAVKERCDNARIEAIEQHGFDRSFSITLTTRAGLYRLFVQLFGPQANAFLLDEKGRIVARMRRVGVLRVRDSFESKPAAAITVHDAIKGGSALSKFLQQELAIFGADELISRIENGPPVYSELLGAYPFAPSQATGEPLHRAGSLSAAIETASESASSFGRLHETIARLQTQLKRAFEAKHYALNQMLATVEDAARAKEFQTRGELILAHTSQAAGSDSLETVDYEGNPITIALDASKTPAENAARLFKRAKKAKHGALAVREQVPIRQTELHEIETSIAALADSTEDAVTRIAQIAKSRGWLREQSHKPGEQPVATFGGKKVRFITETAGYTILWGENSEANDYLTTRVAKANDIWLHVRANVGSHVVIQTMGKPEKVQPVTLRAAARIAVLNSAQKHSKHVPVDYTLAKHVRKPKKSAPGLVTYTNEKTIYADGD